MNKTAGQTLRSKDDEPVLVVPAAVLEEFGAFQGFRPATAEEAEHVVRSPLRRLLRRGDAERDPNFKQLIPYVLLEYAPEGGERSVFVYRRGKGQGEQRLVSKWSAGIGGHVSDADLDKDGRPDFNAGTKREIEEEVVIEAGILSFETFGLVYDPRTEVGSVHLGVVCRMTLDAPLVWANEPDVLESGFRPVDEIVREIEADPEKYESWTALALGVGDSGQNFQQKDTAQS